MPQYYNSLLNARAKMDQSIEKSTRLIFKLTNLCLLVLCLEKGRNLIIVTVSRLKPMSKPVLPGQIMITETTNVNFLKVRVRIAETLNAAGEKKKSIGTNLLKCIEKSLV